MSGTTWREAGIFGPYLEGLCKCGHGELDHTVCEGVCLHVNEEDGNGCSCSGFIPADPVEVVA